MRLKTYSIIGLFVLIISEILMLMGVQPIATWFTPLAWYGYIFFLDGIVLKLKGDSLISSRKKEFFLMLPLSIFFWLVFEYYNILLKGWHYINLPDPLWVRYIGYAVAFSTILPGLFETAEFLLCFDKFKNIRFKKISITKSFLYISMTLGTFLVAFPILYPSPHLWVLVWCGFIFLLEPINYLRGAPSLFRDIEQGVWKNVFSYFIGAYICGILWEFWNYWAYTKWIYTFPPIIENIKIFEMPILGFLGFGPFGLEFYVMYSFIKGLKRKKG
jgi:hypothetical protein